MHNYIVSFPRSGQHLVQRILKYYCSQQNIPFSCCDYYVGECGCNCEPCTSNALFQKHHDTDLSLPIRSNAKYIVLYRADYIDQIEAFYRYKSVRDSYMSQQTEYTKSLDQQVREESQAVEIDYSNERQKNSFLRFAKGKQEYYKKFLQKWVHKKADNIFVLEYDSLTKNPSQITSVFDFLFPDADRTKDQSILDAFLLQEPIVRTRPSAQLQELRALLACT